MTENTKVTNIKRTDEKGIYPMDPNSKISRGKSGEDPNAEQDN
jgi:hypothetical protein